jgi:transcriptional regulator with XRE-family HTH domain
VALPALYVRKDGITDIESESLDGLDEAGKNELKAKFIELRAKGWSYRKLARRLKVSKSTLSNWSIELEEEIASLKAMELEALAEQFYLLKEGRIRLLGGILKRIQKEVLSRDLSGVPTDRLLELLLRYQEALQEEYVEPKPLSGQEMEALRDNPGTDLDSKAIADELGSLLRRYKGGLLDVQEAGRELALLMALLKAREQAVMEERLERLEAVMEQRR